MSRYFRAKLVVAEQSRIVLVFRFAETQLLCIHENVFFMFVVASCIQFKQFDLAGSLGLLGFILFLVQMVFFPLFILKIASLYNRKSVSWIGLFLGWWNGVLRLESLRSDIKYKDMLESPVPLRQTLINNLHIISYIKKCIMLVMVFALESCVWLQISTQIILNAAQIAAYLFLRPYKSRMKFICRILSEMTNVCILILALI